MRIKFRWYLLIVLSLSLIFFISATHIRGERTLTLTAVDATPLDGSTASRTYQASDRTAEYCLTLYEEADAVEITVDGTGSDGHSAIFTIWGYSVNGAADRIYHTVTATLGTAVAGTSRTWVEQFSGTDTHATTIGIKDSGAGGNTKAKIYLDTTGLKYLMFEPITFTTLTTITIHMREYGYK